MASPAAVLPLGFHQNHKCQSSDVGDDDDPSTASWQSTGAPPLEEPEMQRVCSEDTDVPAVKVLSCPASISSGAASPATAAAVRMHRTKNRLAEMLGMAADFPASAAAAPAGPPGRMCGVLSTEPMPSQDMAKVPARKVVSGPVPSDAAAARSFRAKGRIARLLEQDAEGPRYVCGLRLERDLMERSSRMCSKSSVGGVGESSTEGGDEESMSRTWSKGSAGEEESMSMSRAWSKGSAGGEESISMSRAWSKGSAASVAIPFYGRSPTWSVASDLSPKGGERLNRFGMPLDMVTERENCQASSDSGDEASCGEGAPVRRNLTAPPALAAGQGGHPSRTIALALQPELSGDGRHRSSSGASSEGCSGPLSSSHPYGSARARWADVTPTASAGVQDFYHGFCGPPSRDACPPPAGFEAAAPPGGLRPQLPRQPQPPAAPDFCGHLPGPRGLAGPAPAPAPGAKGGKKVGRGQPAPKEQGPRQPPQQLGAQRQGQEEGRRQMPQPQPQRPPPAAPAGSAQQPAGEEGSGATMRDQLRLLKDKERSCVILARRIQYLGFTAPAQLEDHFKAFGPVQDVLVPRSHVKSSYLPSGSKKRQATVRQRPAHLGFVVMESAAGAEAAFAAGAEHTIGETTIVLEQFDEARWGASPEEQQVPQ